MSSRTPRRARRGPTTGRSAWVYIAPAALLAAVTAIMMILSGTGVLGSPSDGGPPPSNTPAGQVQTLSVPQTPPPAEPTVTTVTPLPPSTTRKKKKKPKPKTTTTTTTTTSTATTAATTAATTEATTTDEATTETTSTTPASTGKPGQHVKWTVKTGDTLSSIATQFRTTVKELVRLNPGVDPSSLQVGQELVVR